jgi:DNA-binding GntR family transcriptional regulator
LSVPELARQLNVSRSPVREAVLQLVADGLAVERSRRGVVVNQVAAADLFEIHQIEESLAGLAAGLCAARVTEAFLEAMREVLEEQAVAVQGQDAQRYRLTDGRFHALIAGHCGNRRLEHFLTLLRAELQLGLGVVARDPAHLTRGLAEHRKVLRALERRDAVAAEAAMRTHVARTRKAVEAQLKKGKGGQHA